MVSVVAVVITVLGAAIGITGGLVGFLLFPKLVEDRIEEVLRRESVIPYLWEIVKFFSHNDST